MRELAACCAPGRELNSMELSLVMPCFNESRQILTTFAHLAGYIKNVLSRKADKLTVIAVDDGSKDDTWTCLAEAKQNLLKEVAGTVNVQVKLLRFSRNFGKEAALLAGIRAVSPTAAATVILDADLQHPLEVIVPMIDKFLATGADIVDAVKSDRGKESGLNRWLANSFYDFFDKHSRVNLKNMADFKLLSARAVRILADLPEHERFFRALCSWIGFKHAEVQFEVAEREVGVSKWSFRSKVNLASDAFYAFSDVPVFLQFLEIVFVILLGVGQVAYFAFILLAQKRPLDRLDYLTFIVLLGVFLILGSNLLKSLYLQRLYKAALNRPQYIIMQED